MSRPLQSVANARRLGVIARTMAGDAAKVIALAVGLSASRVSRVQSEAGFEPVQLTADERRHVFVQRAVGGAA